MSLAPTPEDASQSPPGRTPHVTTILTGVAVAVRRIAWNPAAGAMTVRDACGSLCVTMALPITNESGASTSILIAVAPAQ